MPRPIHPQDVANLILYLQVELAFLEQQSDLSAESQHHLRRCQRILRQAIDNLELREWYHELTQAIQTQLGRLEEWF